MTNTLKQITANASYIEIAAQMLHLGGGLGLTTASATEAIMGSLSVDRAGVGSAVNDTTREFGGILGVAIVGSVFASVYADCVTDAPPLREVPADARTAMGESMAAAHRVLEALPAVRVPDVRAAVDAAFLDGLQVGSLVAAVLPRCPRRSWPCCCPRGSRAASPPGVPRTSPRRASVAERTGHHRGGSLGLGSRGW